MSGATAPAHCANCGADLPSTARACPECGADERTGWREQSVYDGLDLPEDESSAASTRKGAGYFWRLTAVVILVGITWLVFTSRF